MASKEEKPVRWRETEESEPSGFLQVVHRRTRVVEGPEAPEGAEIVTDEPHDWKEVKE